MNPRSVPLLLGLAVAGCGAGRPAVVGPLPEPAPRADGLSRATRLSEPTRIDFRWQLNESGSRVRGVGVARVEPPYRARLDLFLDNGETVISAALVEDELRLPPGAPDDVLPPVELMWSTLGVFRPVKGVRLVAGERLDNDADRLRYRVEDGRELHFEARGDALSAVEVLEGESVVEWVRLEGAASASFPAAVTYRNLVDFRELNIVRTDVERSAGFDADVWDPRAR